jgi:hypothetical protein
MTQWQSKGAIGADLYAVDDSPEFTLGTIVTAEDTGSSELGSGEFMYVEGVASAAVGSVVTIDPDGYACALATANAVGPIGACVSALVADKYGWVQVRGVAECKVAASFAADKVAYLTSTAGTVDDAVVAGDEIYGSLSISAIDTPNTGTAYIFLNRSFVTNASN